MSDNEAEALKISRRLSPEHRADFLTWVHLAYVAENSVRKSMGFGVIAGSNSSVEQQDFTCVKNFKRSKK